MTTTDEFATLRTLDPAERVVDPNSPRARADLEHILATSAPDRVPTPARSRRGIRVAALAGAVAIIAGAAIVVLPSLTSGDQAFATWTASPADLSPQAAADAAEECRKAQLDGPGEYFETELHNADTAIAERRGEWTLVTLVGAGGFSALCITDESAALFKDWIGSIGVPADFSEPDSRAVIATDLGTGHMDAGDLSVASGFAGSDVTGVVYRSRRHGEVQATVSSGRFALWLPGDELIDASRAGADVQVTYRDGSTATLRLDLQ